MMRKVLPLTFIGLSTKQFVAGENTHLRRPLWSSWGQEEKFAAAKDDAADVAAYEFNAQDTTPESELRKAIQAINGIDQNYQNPSTAKDDTHESVAYNFIVSPDAGPDGDAHETKLSKVILDINNMGTEEPEPDDVISDSADVEGFIFDTERRLQNETETSSPNTVVPTRCTGNSGNSTNGTSVDDC
jgi:hypothetical protein